MLGLTMAEIIILVIFLLLLAFSTLLNKANKENAQISVLISKNKSLIERIAAVVNLQEPDMAEELVRAVENMPPIIKKIENTKLKVGEGEKIEEVISRAIDKLVIEKSLKGEEASEPEEDKEELSVEEQLAKEKEKSASLEEQVSSLNETLRGFGPPPCWDTGNHRYTEYIFRAELTSKGIVLRDIAQERWALQKSELPIKGINFGKPLSVGSFLSQTQPLRSWSLKKDCNFLVQISDQTQKGEKEVYQAMYKAVSVQFQPDGLGRNKAATFSKEAPSPTKKSGNLFERLFKKQDKSKSSKDMYN